MRLLALLLALACPASLAGCTTLLYEKREATLHVTSSPPGATVWLEDAGGRRVLGTTPLEVEVPYDEAVVDFNEANWAWLVPSVLLTVIGGAMTGAAFGGGDEHTENYDDEESMDFGFGLAICGISLLAAGGSATAFVSMGLGVAQASEQESPIPRIVRLGASLEGHAPVALPLEIGPQIPTLHLRLVPAEKTLEKPAEVPVENPAEEPAEVPTEMPARMPVGPW